jgi:hypothetical protein
MRHLLLITILGFGMTQQLVGQAEALQPGQRVRVTLTGPDPHRLQSTYQQLLGDTLVLSSASYELSDVTKLEVWRGQRSMAGRGALVGFVGGAALGAIIGYSMGDSEGLCTIACTAGQKAAWGAGIGGGAGVLGGLLIGALSKTDKWEEVPLGRLRVSIAPTRGGFGIGTRIAF